MKAVVLCGRGKVEYREVEKPQIGERDLLIEVKACGICGSDLHFFYGGMEPIGEVPLVMGHEFAGIIREVGAKWKDKYQVGTKYTMQPAINIKGSMAAIGYSYPQAAGFWFILYSFCSSHSVWSSHGRGMLWTCSIPACSASDEAVPRLLLSLLPHASGRCLPGVLRCLPEWSDGY